jgi:arsenate reductase
VPGLPGQALRDWAVDDPADQDIETVRRIVDDVDGRVRELLAELGVSVNE